MDESVITGNIVRVIENSAHDQLIAFNRGIGNLLDTPGLETGANPLSPTAFVEAFADALTGVDAEEKIKFQILKVLNQSSLADFTAIYADLNKHLTHLGVMPAPLRAPSRRPGERQRPQQPRPPGAPPAGSAEIDVMSLFRRMASQSSFAMPGMRANGGGGGGPGVGSADLAREVPDDIRLVANAGRHFWQTRLYRRGVGTHAIDVHARHACRGTEPLSSTTLVPPNEIHRQICDVQDHVLDDLGIAAVSGLGRKLA